MCYAGAGVMWALALATLFCICCCWNNIMLGAALMQAASEFVTANLRIMITPLLSYVLVLTFFAWWVVSATWLYSMGNVVAPGNPNLSMMAELDPVDDFAYYTMWYYLFGLFWVVAFFLSLQKFIVVLDDFKAPVTAMSKCFDGVAFGTAAGKIHFWDEFLYKPTKIIDITRGDWPFKTLSPLIVSIDYNQQRIMAATKNGDLIEINLKGDIQAHRINTLVRLTSPTSNALAILTQ